MLQVTMDLETELYMLEQRRLRLVKLRDTMIETAEGIIDRANKEFDHDVVPLGRAINELRERLKKEDPPKSVRIRVSTVPDGLDQEDEAHFRELLAKRKRKH